MMKCPKCSREIDESYFPLGLVHCPYCGRKIGSEEPLDTLPFCRICGERLLTEVAFCPRCGQRTAPMPEKGVRQAEPAPRVVEIVPAPQPVIPAPAPTSAPPPVAEAPPACYRQPKTLPRPRAPVWPKVKAFVSRFIKPVKERFSDEGQLEKLYQSWSVKDGLPAEEIPSPQQLKALAHHQAEPTLREPAADVASSPALSMRMVLLIAGGVVVIFVAIGVTLWGLSG